jgi:hypothetical protein
LKAPEGVEQALRSRADEFYQLQIDGKFRASERLVCESSQEAYYLASKRQWLSKEIVRAEFDEGFKSAKVSILLGTEAMMPLGVIRLKSVVPTAWRLEEGGWCFHIPESDQKERDTPFGKMSSAPAGPAGASVAPPTVPSVDPKMVMSAVAVTRSELRLKGYEESADEVELVNSLAGAVELELIAPQMPGLKVTLSATRLGRNEKAQVKATYTPADRSPKPAGKITIRVIPTGQVLDLALVFDSPAVTAGKLPDIAPPKLDD